MQLIIRPSKCWFWTPDGNCGGTGCLSDRVNMCRLWCAQDMELSISNSLKEEWDRRVKTWSGLYTLTCWCFWLLAVWALQALIWKYPCTRGLLAPSLDKTGFCSWPLTWMLSFCGTSCLEKSPFPVGFKCLVECCFKNSCMGLPGGLSSHLTADTVTSGCVSCQLFLDAGTISAPPPHIALEMSSPAPAQWMSLRFLCHKQLIKAYLSCFNCAFLFFLSSFSTQAAS